MLMTTFLSEPSRETVAILFFKIMAKEGHRVVQTGFASRQSLTEMTKEFPLN
jgi:hypothetical protein